jgi:hypothetical protein
MMNQIEASIRANTHAMVSALKAKTLPAWLNTTVDDIKSAKTANGPKRATKNATVLVRFAHQDEIEHPLIQSYAGGDSGVNPDNDFNSLNRIAYEVVMKHAVKLENGQVDPTATAEVLGDLFVKWLTPPADDAADDAAVDFGDAPSDAAVDFGDFAEAPDDDDDDDDDTLTVRSVVFDSLNNATFATIQAITDVEIDRAIAWLYNVNNGGMGYRMTMNGAKQVSPNTFTGRNNNGPKTWSKWGQVADAVADILRIAPKRQVKREDRDKSFKRGWFTELVSNGDRNADITKKRILMKVFAAVVLKSERNFYNRRLAWSVSDDFAEALRETIGVNSELMESPVIGSVNGAKSWVWATVKNDWTPTSKVTDTDIDNMSLNDLMNL